MKNNSCPVKIVLPVEVFKKLLGDKSIKYLSANLDLKNQYLELEISQKNYSYRFMRGKESLRVSFNSQPPFKLED